MQSIDAFLASVERRAFVQAQVATGNREDALEIVQEAMLRLVQHYTEKDAGEWPPLFHRLLQNAIRDWHRKEKLWRPLRAVFGLTTEGADPIDALPGEGEDPQQKLGQERFADDLEHALHQLPHRQQQAFLLRAWEQLSVAETAEAMGVSEGSVKTHYSRAIKRVAELMESYR